MLEPKALKELSLLLSRLPGIGPKTAKRLAVFIFSENRGYLDELSEVLKEVKKGISRCKFCGVYSDSDPCEVCADITRDFLKLFLVRSSLDVYTIENSGVYKGQYLVLDDYNFEDSYDSEKLEALVKRVSQRIAELINLAKKHKYFNSESVIEVIFGFGTTIEEQTVLLYIKSKIAKRFKSKVPIKFTRLAIGLSPGGALDYTDQFTLSEALKGRREI